MATALTDLSRLNDQNLVCLADSGTGHGVKPVGKRGENIPGPGRLACSLNSFSVAPGRAYSNLARMVSWKRWASWGTTPTVACSDSSVASRTLWPPIGTVPDPGSHIG